MVSARKKKESTTADIQTLLVAMDLSLMDAQLIRCASYLSTLFPIREIHFLHVVPDRETVHSMPQDYLKQISEMDEDIKLTIKKSVYENFGKSHGVKFNIKVHEGSPTDRIFRYVNLKSIDMILMGRKKELRGSGLVAHSVAAQAPAHLLLVPESQTRLSFKNLLLPVDFSKHSQLAWSLSKNIQDKTQAAIHFVHTYRVPMGYSKSGKTYEEFAEILCSHAQSEFESWSKQPIENCHFFLLKKEKEADVVMKLGDKVNADLVVIGSKGRTNLATLFLGSFAEKIMIANEDIPLLIVKRKNENMNLLEALLSL